MLAIDLGSDVLPALALGAEPPEPDAMERPPRRRTRAALSRAGSAAHPVPGRLIQSVGVCVVFFWHIHAAGIPFDAFTADNPVYREAITMTQAGIVVSQFFNSLAVRTGPAEHLPGRVAVQSRGCSRRGCVGLRAHGRHQLPARRCRPSSTPRR